ncbi:hypothetical protein Tco_0828100, partial [Tanacetum coccineum]
RNKNKQKTASKKSNMVSNAMNDMVDLDGESDSRNCNEIVENGGVGTWESIEVMRVIRRILSKGEMILRILMALMVTVTDMKIVNNKLDFIPTEISKEGSEIVIFDEALVEKDSAQ